MSCRNKRIFVFYKKESRKREERGDVDIPQRLLHQKGLIQVPVSGLKCDDVVCTGVVVFDMFQSIDPRFFWI